MGAAAPTAAPSTAGCDMPEGGPLNQPMEEEVRASASGRDECVGAGDSCAPCIRVCCASCPPRAADKEVQHRPKKTDRWTTLTRATGEKEPPWCLCDVIPPYVPPFVFVLFLWCWSADPMFRSAPKPVWPTVGLPVPAACLQRTHSTEPEHQHNNKHDHQTISLLSPCSSRLLPRRRSRPQLRSALHRRASTSPLFASVSTAG